MKTVSRLATLLVLLVLAVSLLGPLPAKAQTPKTIVIGGLLPLTGEAGLAEQGRRAAAALQVAVEDVNAYLQSKGAWFRLKARVEDTYTNPDAAVQKFNTLAAAGIKFIIGPMSSAEVAKIKDLATEKNIIIISPSSTAVQLAISGDNVFRFCTSDDVQSKAIASIARELGIKAVVMIIRADTWGQGLKEAMAKLFDQAGIEYKPYEYNPESRSFAGVVSSAAKDVEQYISKYGASKVMVALVAFSEAAELLKLAKNYEALRSVIWTGSDGTAKLEEISGDIEAASFAQETLFINPLYAPEATENQKIVAEKIKKMPDVVGEPDAYSYAVYDAVWAIALALLDANPEASPDELVRHVKAKLENNITMTPEFAAHATTGAFPLNAAGDRATADYDLWVVYNGTWILAGKYRGPENKIEWFKPEIWGGKTYVDMFNAKFKLAPATPTTTPTATTVTPTTPALPTTTPTLTETPTTQPAASPTTTPGGIGAGTIAAIVVVVIVVVAVAAYLARRTR